MKIRVEGVRLIHESKASLSDSLSSADIARLAYGQVLRFPYYIGTSCLTPQSVFNHVSTCL